MGVTKNMIIVEDRLREMFNQLPPHINVDLNASFPIKFKYGDNLELLSFLKQNQGSESPYPLIWLVYPYEEDHQRTHVKIDGMSLILASETNMNMFNEERIETTYKQILFPLYENIKVLFEQSNIIITDGTFRVSKFPNYSSEELPGEENQTVDIWDALKITFDCQINDWCLNTINF